MKKFGVFGVPILHSLSPKLFDAAYHSDYSYIRLIANNPNEAMLLAEKLGLSGINITAPFKNVNLWGEGKKSGDVEFLGFTNTILIDGNVKQFYNTDIDGVSYKLDNIIGEKCLVLGAGGAGITAAYALKKLGGEVILANRTVEKAANAAQKIGCDYCSLEEAQMVDAKIVVNTLKVKILDIKQNQILIDAIYHNSPYQNQFATGLHWLIGQAVTAYRLFTNQEPDIEAMINIDPKIPTTIKFVGDRSNELTKLFPPNLIAPNGVEIWLYDGESDHFQTAWAVIDATTKSNQQIYEEIYRTL